VDEARKIFGLPPLGGDEGQKTIAELLEHKADTITAAAQAEAGGSQGNPQ